MLGHATTGNNQLVWVRPCRLLPLGPLSLLRAWCEAGQTQHGRCAPGAAAQHRQLRVVCILAPRCGQHSMSVRAQRLGGACAVGPALAGLHACGSQARPAPVGGPSSSQAPAAAAACVLAHHHTSAACCLPAHAPAPLCACASCALSECCRCTLLGLTPALVSCPLAGTWLGRRHLASVQADSAVQVTSVQPCRLRHARPCTHVPPAGHLRNKHDEAAG